MPPLLTVWILPWSHGLSLRLPEMRPSARRWVGVGLAVPSLAIGMAGFGMGLGGQSSPWMPLSFREEREHTESREHSSGPPTATDPSARSPGELRLKAASLAKG